MDLTAISQTTKKVGEDRKSPKKKEAPKRKRGKAKDKIVKVRAEEKEAKVDETQQTEVVANQGQIETVEQTETIVDEVETEEPTETIEEVVETDSPKKVKQLSEVKEPDMRKRWLFEMDSSLYKMFKELPSDDRERVQTALSGSDHRYLTTVAGLFDLSLRDLLRLMTAQLRKKHGTKIKDLRLREVEFDDI